MNIHDKSIVWITVSTAILVLVAGLIPASAKLFESSMINHMLIQMPLLALAGAALLVNGTRLYQLLARADPYGGIALVLGTGCLLFWMLPMHLDLATMDPLFRLLKVISIPTGIGMCFRWIWLRSNAIVKTAVLIEAWAAITRLGWLYLESPEQLCSSYLIGEQKTVGMCLLAISAVSGVVGITWGIFGSFGAAEETRSVKASAN